MTRPQGYVDAEYLRTVAALLAPVKQRSFECMRIAPGARLLDVGCGIGADTIALARIGGPNAQVVGVDIDSAMLAKADDRAKAAGTIGSVRHQLADAARLPFADQSFDACRSER